MTKFRDRPIGQKLVIISMATTAVAMLLAGAGIVLADAILFRGYLQRDLSALTRIVADNSTGALAFEDPDSAAQTLGALRARPHVNGACIYRSDGSMLAQYARDQGFHCPPPDREQAIHLSGVNLVGSQPILLNGRRIGTLMLEYGLG